MVCDYLKYNNFLNSLECLEAEYNRKMTKTSTVKYGDGGGASGQQPTVVAKVGHSTCPLCMCVYVSQEWGRSQMGEMCFDIARVKLRD